MYTVRHKHVHHTRYTHTSYVVHCTYARTPYARVLTHLCRMHICRTCTHAKHPHCQDTVCMYSTNNKCIAYFSPVLSLGSQHCGVVVK